MENWEFLLQRKGDKSWLPLESPTVEILEGQYRLAARSDGANQLVAIAIAYRPLADIRHQPLQQKIAKRVSHDGLLIVMPYTNFVPGLWQIDCDIDPDIDGDIDQDGADDSTSEHLASKKIVKKTVKFDVIPISSEAGSEWQYSEPEDEIPTSLHTNSLGIDQAEPSPLGSTLGSRSPSYSSPILDIAEQRSTELVQSMFDDFSLFDDELFDDEPSDQDKSDQEVLSAQVDTNSAIAISESITAPTTNLNTPRILLRLQQPQYLINEDNSFLLTGEAYTNGEIEVTLKDPQTLDVIVSMRYVAIRAVPFAYQVSVPPPSEIQVLIGEVKIYPQQDFQQHGDLFIMQQAIAVSYPASRVLPELIKEAEKYNSQNPLQDNSQASQTTEESINHSSYPQSPQSYPQVASQTEARSPDRSPQSKPANSLSLPPLPSNKPKSSERESTTAQRPASALSLPPLPPFVNKAFNPPSSPPISRISEPYPESFPQVEADDLQQIDLLISDEDEPELIYSFEEETH